jgi:hypothetical protein
LDNGRRCFGFDRQHIILWTGASVWVSSMREAVRAPGWHRGLSDFPLSWGRTDRLVSSLYPQALRRRRIERRQGAGNFGAIVRAWAGGRRCVSLVRIVMSTPVASTLPELLGLSACAVAGAAACCHDGPSDPAGLGAKLDGSAMAATVRPSQGVSIVASMSANSHATCAPGTVFGCGSLLDRTHCRKALVCSSRFVGSNSVSPMRAARLRRPSPLKVHAGSGTSA